MQRAPLCLLVGSLLAFVACDVGLAGLSFDAGSPALDAGQNHDAGALDSGAHDAGVADAGSSDAGTTDAGQLDAATPQDAGADAGRLIWSDEFNAADGTAVDSTKWTVEVSGTGNGNQELEYYLNSTTTLFQSGGNLVIRAAVDSSGSHSCWYGTCQYVSGRINSAAHFQQAYGRFEARIQIPRGKGIWPAFWALGNNIGPAGWPTCGEIDIMENIGSEPSTLHGSLHGPGYSGGQPLTGSYVLPGGQALADDFHLYAVDWSPTAIKFSIDNHVYETRVPADVPAGTQWVYDHPFFIILNLAVGGLWPGNPDSNTTFPQQMKVDYVRVYAL